MNLFVVDPHTIYRRGLVACLEGLPEVTSVHQAESVRDAWESPPLFESDLVLVDHVMPGGPDFVGAVGESTGARVIVCSSHCATTDSLATSVRAAANGTGVLTPELLRDLLDGLAAGVERPVVARLTDREQQVLALIAEGHPTREVAEQLCYSERTVKNVLHDVVTKLGARSRSQAVAHAVREGLI